MTKPDRDTKRWNPWESEEDVVIDDSETDETPCAL